MAAVYRKTVEFAKVIDYDRRGNPYVYGGSWDPFNRAEGTDCSDCVGKNLAAVRFGTAMSWRREVSTENWRPPWMGGGVDPNNGPYGTIIVDSPAKIPADAVVKIALHHGPGGGANSHMWCEVDGLRVETHGSDDEHPDGVTALGDDAMAIDNPYANCWAYLPGPITEDGTPRVTGPSSPPSEAPDTLFPDVSEFQVPVDDSFLAEGYEEGGHWPYRWLSIRSNDGNHIDKNFAQNYAWCVHACEAGKLDGFIVYYYWHPDGSSLARHKDLVTAQGGPHRKMVSMIDVESGGNPAGNFSDELNGEDADLSEWLGDPRRVIAYGNSGDLNSLWPNRREDQFIVAGYGSNPDFPGKIAHQYTDGQGYGGGLPEGAAPFGNCDMNSADGFSPSALAAALGVAGPPPEPTPEPEPPRPQTFEEWLHTATDRQLLEYLVEQAGPGNPDWASKGMTLRDKLWSLATPAKATRRRKKTT